MSPDDELKFDPQDVFEAGLRNHHRSNTAYPIAHERTWRAYRVARDRMTEVAARAWRGIREMCLYVHMPFCEARCSYCGYTVVGAEENAGVRVYVDDLLREIEMYADRSRLIRGFDIGGGTPSFVPAGEIARVIEKTRECFRFGPGDMSIETTPRIAAAEPDRIAAYRRTGIDRISMGVQVIESDLLATLNRSANGAEHNRRAVENIRAAGFDRLNVDLMYGFAGQRTEGWAATLRHAIALGPESITLYRMRYKRTRLSLQAPRVTLEQVRLLHTMARQILLDAGYRGNPGKTTYSRVPGDVGTSSYLKHRVVEGMPYLGLGLGAQSFTHTTISYNEGAATKTLAPYRGAVAADRLPIQDLYDLPPRQMMAKFCAVSFYFGEIDSHSFQGKFGVPLTDVFRDEIDFALRRGLMHWSQGALALTSEGALSVNGVIALFFAPSVQKILVERGNEILSSHKPIRLEPARV